MKTAENKKEEGFFGEKFPKGLIESLSFRVFIISLILIVIPLLIHNIFLYHHDYVHRKKDVFSAFQLLGESRVLLIDKIVEHQMTFLREAVIGFNFENETKEQFFEKIRGKVGHLELAYFSLGPDGTLICRASTEIDIIGKDFTEHHEAFVKALKSKEDIFVYHSKTTGEYWINVSITHYADDGTTPVGLWTAGVPARYLVERVKGKKNFAYPFNMSIITKNYEIVASSVSEMISKKISTDKNDKDSSIFLEPEKKIMDAYILTVNGEKYFASIIPMEKWKLNLLLAVKESHVTSVNIKSYLYHILSFVFFLILIGGGGSILLINRIAKPMRSLCNTMERVSQGDMLSHYSDDKWGFEINILGHYYNKMIESIVRHQKQVQVERMQKQTLEQELKIGHNIQKSMLPMHPPEVPGLDIAMGYMPAKEVGGDFYDLFITNDNKLVMTMADTSGKGISACMYSLTVRSLLRSYVSYGIDLAEAIRLTNQLFIKDVEISGVFVTAWFGLYDPKTRMLNYTSAGHYPALIIRNNSELIELNTKGIALGVEKEAKNESKSIQLQKNDLLILYTDGIIDANNSKDEFYGTQRLKEFMKKNSSMPSKQIIKALFNEIKNFSEMVAQYDDIATLIIRVQ